jgi:LytS/YehU family sensor histidine kinase
VLEGFGTLLRQMQITDAVEVPLHEELAFAATYLTLQQARFGDHLTAEIDATVDARDILVPRLFLQPLVENAVRHGVAQREEPGAIIVRARVAAGDVVVEVLNDGPSLPPHWSLANRSGVGLTTVARSLQLLHPGAHRLELANVPTGGVCATVAFPVSRSLAATAMIERTS